MASRGRKGLVAAALGLLAWTAAFGLGEILLRTSTPAALGGADLTSTIIHAGGCPPSPDAAAALLPPPREARGPWDLASGRSLGPELPSPGGAVPPVLCGDVRRRAIVILAKDSKLHELTRW